MVTRKDVGDVLISLGIVVLVLGNLLLTCVMPVGYMIIAFCRSLLKGS